MYFHGYRQIRDRGSTMCPPPGFNMVNGLSLVCGYWFDWFSEPICVFDLLTGGFVTPKMSGEQTPTPSSKGGEVFTEEQEVNCEK